jgi:hypothetical protein
MGVLLWLAKVGYKGLSHQRGNYNVRLFNKIAATFNCKDVHSPTSGFCCPTRGRPELNAELGDL